jgi:hypothetical protein
MSTALQLALLTQGKSLDEEDHIVQIMQLLHYEQRNVQAKW